MLLNEKEILNMDYSNMDSKNLGLSLSKRDLVFINPQTKRPITLGVTSCIKQVQTINCKDIHNSKNIRKINLNSKNSFLIYKEKLKHFNDFNQIKDSTILAIQLLNRYYNFLLKYKIIQEWNDITTASELYTFISKPKYSIHRSFEKLESLVNDNFTYAYVSSNNVFVPAFSFRLVLKSFLNYRIFILPTSENDFDVIFYKGGSRGGRGGYYYSEDIDSLFEHIENEVFEHLYYRQELKDLFDVNCKEDFDVENYYSLYSMIKI